MLNDDNNGYFWNNWTPIGMKPLFETEKNVPHKELEDDSSAIVSKWEYEF